MCRTVVGDDIWMEALLPKCVGAPPLTILFSDGIDRDKRHLPNQGSVGRDLKESISPGPVRQWRRDINDPHVPGTHIVQTLIDARQHIARSQHHLVGLSGPALQGRVVHGAVVGGGCCCCQKSRSTTHHRRQSCLVFDFQHIAAARARGATDGILRPAHNHVHFRVVVVDGVIPSGIGIVAAAAATIQVPILWRRGPNLGLFAKDQCHWIGPRLESLLYSRRAGKVHHTHAGFERGSRARGKMNGSDHGTRRRSVWFIAQF